MLLVAALVVILVGAGPASADPEAIPMLDGSAVRLADYQGQTVVLNFWASWCPPCRAEMPTLDAYYQAHRDEGLVLLAINSGETAETARSFIAQTGFTFPVGLDTDYDLSNQFGVDGLPVTIVLNPDGQIVYRHSGMITQEVLEETITPLLSGG
jgi:thiol-disulfide isomerase/thioredoxin